MRTFIIRRLILGFITLVVVSLVVFVLSRITGDPVVMFLDITATEQDRALLTASLGLDKPWHVQYLLFLERAIMHGDLGKSISQNRPVTELIMNRLWNTVRLGAVAFCISVALAMPMGILSAIHRNGWWDWFVKAFALLGQAVPRFWLGIVFILIFSVQLKLLAPAGMGGPSTFILPSLTLGWPGAAGMTRLLRSSMLDILGSDFVLTARGKGLAEPEVIIRHALRNALIPTVAYSTLEIVRVFVVGSIVVETVFGWPGLGRLAYEATSARDYPLLQGIVVVVATLVVLMNLIGDLLYGWLDPRIRYS